jgi:hypothetical protein
MAEQERAEEEAVDRQGDEAEMMARLQEELSNLPVSDHLVYMMHSLSALGVSRLGLAADAAERQDLSQARLAIDAFKALLGVLEQARPFAELAAHRGMLSQLQLAYAAAIGKPSTDDRPQPAAEKPEAPPAGGETPGGREEAPPTGDAAPRKKPTGDPAPGEPAGEAAPPKKPAPKKAAPKKPAAPAKKAGPKKAPKPAGGSQTGS